ncbi:hypothetical protein NFG33_00810 [Proteus mirabilis]|uniref:hypothetical protein n=1 Tax=Proteus TaxID=583 RepID=UPI0018680159|nr:MULTISPECIES: hypothetical protein [Proteus]MDF7489385.1 hypothetical protein [Proteus mirabilis]
MSRYKVLKKSFIAGRLLEIGEEVEYDGIAGDNLALIGGADARLNTHSVADGAGDNTGKGVSNIAVSGSGVAIDSSLDALREQYTQLFGKAPHHNMGADKMRTAIDEKRKELGV